MRRLLRVTGVNTVRFSLSLRPPLLIQISLTTEAQSSTQIQGGGLVGLGIVELYRHAYSRAIPGGAEPLARSLRHDYVGHGLDAVQVLLRGYNAVINNDESLLLEPDHDLSVVHVLQGRLALVCVSIGAAQALLGVAGEVLRRGKERTGV